MGLAGGGGSANGSLPPSVQGLSLSHNEQVRVLGECTCVCHRYKVLKEYCDCGWLRLFPQDAAEPTRRRLRAQMRTEVRGFGSWQPKRLLQVMKEHRTHEAIVK